MKRLPSRLISGPILVGFWGAFDNAHGRSDSPWPYPVVTPSAIGPALLPFECPYCGTVCSELVDPKTRGHYFDKLRKFSWCPCPDCHGRFFVDRKGQPLGAALPAGAISAPALVERAGGVRDGAAAATRFDMLGAITAY
jgi:hypothetical protein